MAIATDLTYQEAYDLINAYSKDEKPSKRRRGKSSSRTGVHAVTFKKVMADLGWEWTPTMQIGSGCTVHVKKDESPEGRLILRLSRHMAAFIDGELHDSFDSSRNGTRCVYGYWKELENPDPSFKHSLRMKRTSKLLTQLVTDRYPEFFIADINVDPDAVDSNLYKVE